MHALSRATWGRERADDIEPWLPIGDDVELAPHDGVVIAP